MAPDQSPTVPFAGARLLPVEYRPCKNTVVLGRGKKIAQLEGNARLRMLVSKELKAYTSSKSNKTDKSFIIRHIMKRVQENSLERIGFVKRDSTSGRWYAVPPTMARATIAQAFRDANFFKYKSSKQAKQLRRLNSSSDEENSLLNLSLLSTNGVTPSLCRSIPTSAKVDQKQHSDGFKNVRGSLKNILDEAIEYIEGNNGQTHGSPFPKCFFSEDIVEPASKCCLSEDPFEPVPFSKAMGSAPFAGALNTASHVSFSSPSQYYGSF